MCPVMYEHSTRIAQFQPTSSCHLSKLSPGRSHNEPGQPYNGHAADSVFPGGTGASRDALPMVKEPQETGISSDSAQTGHYKAQEHIHEGKQGTR